MKSRRPEAPQLPADLSPHSAPGGPDQPDRPDRPGGTGGAPQWPDGQPRPFFADRPDQPDRPDRPDQPDQPGLIGSPYGQPISQGPRYGWPPQQDGTGRPDDQQGGLRPASQAPQRPDQQRQAPQRPAQQRQAPQRPGRPPERELRQRAIASAVFGLVALIALFGLGTDLHRGVYLLIFSAVVGIAGLVIGITALVKAHRTGSYRPRFAVAGIVFGALATLIAVPILATYLAFPTQVTNYINCLNQSQQNSTSQQSCMTKFYKSIHLGAQARAARTDPSTASSLPARLPTGR